MYPKVILSAGNISHYHHTALALQQAGYLWKHLCVFGGKNDLGVAKAFLPVDMRLRLMGKALPGLDPKKIQTFSSPYLFTQVLRRIGLTGQARTDSLFGAMYDWATLQKADDADIFHFVNGMGLRTAERARQRGCILICDVRAEHVDYQEVILQSEYEKLRLPYRSTRALYRDRLVAEYMLADFLVVPSSFVAETLIRSGIAREKVFVAPYGVDPSRFSSSKAFHERDETRRKGPFRILFVGQLMPLKGIHYLIRALANLSHLNMEVVIVGSGDAEYLTLLQGLMCSRVPVRLVGHIPQVELAQYYLQSDVLVLPSLSDSFGLVVLEAMTAGLPTIVSENTGAKELIQDSIDGFVVPIRDTGTLEEKLVYMYEHPEKCQEMSRAAICKAQEYTWEHYGERLLDIYHQILTEKGE